MYTLSVKSMWAETSWSAYKLKLEIFSCSHCRKCYFPRKRYFPRKCSYFHWKFTNSVNCFWELVIKWMGWKWIFLTLVVIGILGIGNLIRQIWAEVDKTYLKNPGPQSYLKYVTGTQALPVSKFLAWGQTPYYSNKGGAPKSKIFWSTNNSRSNCVNT